MKKSGKHAEVGQSDHGEVQPTTAQDQNPVPAPTGTDTAPAIGMSTGSTDGAGILHPSFQLLIFDQHRAAGSVLCGKLEMPCIGFCRSVMLNPWTKATYSAFVADW